MKKVLFMISILAVMLSTMAPVFATSKITTDSTDKTSNVLVTYGVENTYTVTIPAEFKLSGTTILEGPVSASDVVIPYGTSLNVTIESDNYDSTWNLVDLKEGASANKVPYNIGKSKSDNTVGTVVASKDVVLSVSAGTKTGSQTLYVQVPTVPTVAGDYQDTIKFTVEVK